METFGKAVILVGVVVVVIGLVIYALARLVGGWLPGDLVVRRGGWTIAFPIVTSLVVSVVLTVLLNLFLRR